METILIADDHEIVRMGIRSIIENQPKQYIVVEAATCAEVIQALSNHPVQFTILEMFLADGNIFSTVHQFMESVSATSVLVYSMNEKIYARRLMQKGIRGFVSKKAPVQELENAIHCLLKGEIYLSAGMKEDFFKPGKADLFINFVDSLSDRELEVVEYLAIGQGATEIAQKMKLDITTVSTYRRRAFEKLGVHNVIELKEKFLLYKMQG
jgi:two-component system, NarL family, invasion response regulator UvrY